MLALAGVRERRVGVACNDAMTRTKKTRLSPCNDGCYSVASIPASDRIVVTVTKARRRSVAGSIWGPRRRESCLACSQPGALDTQTLFVDATMDVAAFGRGDGALIPRQSA